MELKKRTITILPHSDTTEAQPLKVPILELRCGQAHVHYLREAIMNSKTNTRGHGIFIPTPFLREEKEAVYKTAVRHLNYLHTLRAVPVSGIHHTLLDLDISANDEPSQTFFQCLHSVKESSKEMGKPASYLFNAIEDSQMTKLENGISSPLTINTTRPLPTLIIN